MRREFLIQLKSDFFKIPTRFNIEATCKRSEKLFDVRIVICTIFISRFAKTIIAGASKNNDENFYKSSMSDKNTMSLCKQAKIFEFLSNISISLTNWSCYMIHIL